ncbi:MAG: hypothetical protein JSV74_00425 [Dehalococcoidia bacterium]|nr:MAG: hypothetical protein JSV74_00425 [Dehalococcoidia bacterium]
MSKILQMKYLLSVLILLLGSGILPLVACISSNTQTVTNTQTTTLTITEITRTSTTPILTTTSVGTTTTTAINKSKAVFAVLDFILPPYGHHNEPFTIPVVATNTGGNQGNYDIILNIIKEHIPEESYTYTKSVMLFAGETKEFVFTRVELTEGSYIVTIGDISKYLVVFPHWNE